MFITIIYDKDVKPLGANSEKEAQEKVSFIKNKFLASQSRQKEDAHHKVRDMAFMVGEHILLKVSPAKRVIRLAKRESLTLDILVPLRFLREQVRLRTN